MEAKAPLGINGRTGNARHLHNIVRAHVIGGPVLE